MWKNFALVLFIASLFSSCDSDSKAFEKASKANTVEAYKDYTKKYPLGKFTKAAKEILKYKKPAITL